MNLVCFSTIYFESFSGKIILFKFLNFNRCDNVIIRLININWTSAKQKFDLLIMSMITD